jgi:periplasmic divalent cation tolerance protein
MSQPLVIFVTAPNQEEAMSLAEACVCERLVACVNLIPAIESVYRWEGKVAKDSEVLLIMKTTAERFEDLARRVQELHSYETPEIIALKIEQGSNAYLEWLSQSVSGEK